MKKVFLIVTILLIFVLSACVPKREIKLLPSSQVTSLKYRTWLMPNANLSIKGETCKLEINDYVGYIDVEDGEPYSIYPYENAYIGIDDEASLNTCFNFLPFYGYLDVANEYLSGIEYDKNNDKYFKSDDSLNITIYVNEEGYINYYLAEDAQGNLIFELYDFNTTDFTLPEYTLYTPIEFVLTHYDTFDYVLFNNVLTTSREGWDVTMDFDENEMILENGVKTYTYHRMLGNFLDNDTQVTYTSITSLYEVDDTINPALFLEIVDIFIEERNYSEYFEIPDLN